MFDKELLTMQRCLLSKMRDPNYKQMAVNLTRLDPMHKEKILKSYFKICTLAYAIRNSLGYIWDVAKQDRSQLF